MDENFRFNLEEFAGAIGDYGTLIPIIIGVAAVTNIKLAPMLLFFGLSYIATGLYYKLPMPVEPMKAIGAIAISGGLTSSQIAGAGIMTGIILLIVGLTDAMKYVKQFIPRWLIRGIQLGLALTLVKTAFSFISSDFRLGFLAVGIIIVFNFLPIKDISSLIVFGLGLGIGIYFNGFPPLTTFSWPVINWPTISSLWTGFVHGTLPQLPLTLGNAVLATSLLIIDLFERKVPERKLVTSMGLMCIISSPLGGFPMCHGAGGLAAQYRFGARTGGSNIISGIILLIIAFFFGSQELVNIIPFAVLGALLIFSALQLLKSSFKSDNIIFTVITALIALFGSISTAFIIMLGFYFINEYIIKRKIGD